MSAVDLVDYLPLVDALKVPLPDKVKQRDELRRAVAFAESYGVIVSQHRRKLLVQVEHQTAKALKELREGWASEEEAEKSAKLNADEKKILLTARVSDISAELEFVTKLEELIKRRCSLGQSILNSINNELATQWNK